MTDAPQQDDPGSPFAVHTRHGSRAEVRETIDHLLYLVNREWRRRQFIAFGLALVAAGVGIYFLFVTSYFFGLLCLIGAGIIATFGFSSGRFLAVEIETLTLIIALLDELDKSLDPDGNCHMIIDMRSSVHASKTRASSGADPEVLDEWFHLRLPLADGFGLELVLTEHVHTEGSHTRKQVGRRMGRDYHVALYSGHLFRETSLCEAVISHVSAPSGTSISSRVREGLDAFDAAVEQLRLAYAETRTDVEAVDVDFDRASTVINPRARADKAANKVARKRQNPRRS